MNALHKLNVPSVTLRDGDFLSTLMASPPYEIKAAKRHVMEAEKPKPAQRDSKNRVRSYRNAMQGKGLFNIAQLVPIVGKNKDTILHAMNVLLGTGHVIKHQLKVIGQKRYAYEWRES